MPEGTHNLEARSNGFTLYHNHFTLKRRWEAIWPYLSKTIFLVSLYPAASNL